MPNGIRQTNSGVVITNNGVAQTVVSSGPTLPSSAIFRWKLDEGTGTTAADSIGSQDGTINGAGWVADSAGQAYQGGNALSADGTNDYVDTGTWNNFGSNIGSDWAIAFTVSYSSNSGERLISTVNTSGMNFEVIAGGWDAPSGGLALALNDSNSDPSVLSTDNAYDQSVNRVLFNVGDGDDLSTWEAYVNNSAVSTTVSATEGSKWQDFQYNVNFFCRNYDGTYGGTAQDSFIQAILDDIIVYNSSLSSQEISDDYNIQPWA